MGLGHELDALGLGIAKDLSQHHDDEVHAVQVVVVQDDGVGRLAARLGIGVGFGHHVRKRCGRSHDAVSGCGGRANQPIIAARNGVECEPGGPSARQDAQEFLRGTGRSWR